MHSPSPPHPVPPCDALAGITGGPAGWGGRAGGGSMAAAAASADPLMLLVLVLLLLFLAAAADSGVREDCAFKLGNEGWGEWVN